MARQTLLNDRPLGLEAATRLKREMLEKFDESLEEWRFDARRFLLARL